MYIDIFPGKRILLTGNDSYEISKTCLEFLFNGVKDSNDYIGEPDEFKSFFEKHKKGILSGDRGLYYTTYSPIEEFIKKYESLFFFKRKFINEGYVNFIDLNIVTQRLMLNKNDKTVFLQQTIDLIGEMARNLDVDRLVIDSFNSLFYRFENLDLVKTSLNSISKLFDELNCKILLTSVKNEDLLVSYDDINVLLKKELNIHDVVKI